MIAKYALVNFEVFSINYTAKMSCIEDALHSFR